MKTNRAYSLLTIKAADDEKRIIEGIATTPEPDRSMDVIELDGIDYKLPLPFLLQHNSRQPIGKVIEAKAVKGEMRVKIQVAAAGIATYIDEAWSLIKAGLIPGLSIGFRAIEEAYNRETGGFHYIKTEWVELSAVTIPMNADATILSVKSADAAVLAASGKERTVVVRLDSNPPGVSGKSKSPQKGPEMTIKEQITQFENKRAASTARMDEIMKKAADAGATLDATETEEYDTLKGEVKSIDEHLVRLKDHEATLIAKAVAVPDTPKPGASATAAAAARREVITVKSNLPKGTTFARCVMALANAGIGGSAGKREAAELAKQHWPDHPEVELILRAAVAAGNTTNSTWAAPLIPAAQNMQGELLELLRPATLLGRIPGLRRVPFNISVPAQTGGGTYGWVGEGQAKPVSALAFSAVTLAFHKIAGIIVLTKELVRFSNPSAEAIVRDDMVKGIAQYIDTQFTDPTVAANGAISPASITNGATTAAASGTTAADFRDDMAAAFATFISANEDPASTVILMSATVALNLSLLQNALGQPEFPNIGIGGGTILGIPVVVSQAVGARIIIINANDILLADDGPVEIDISEQASIVMDSAPQASPQTTELVSLWQRNYVGLRAEKFITWKKARSTSVYYISNAVYSG